MAKQIIELFPKHKTYLEPFGGGGSVLFAKKPSPVETYNDINLRVTRFFRVLKTQGNLFIKLARLTPYSLAEFEDAMAYPKEAHDVTKALKDFIRWRQSMGGRGESWSYSTARSRGSKADAVNGWLSAVELLPLVVERLRNVQIDCEPAIKAIERFDNDEGLIYADPPYLDTTRVSKNVYEHEMTVDDHRKLAKLLNRCKSRVILSGYPSKLYDKWYKDWKRFEIDIANHSAGGKKKRRMKEVLWLNYDPSRSKGISVWE